MVRSTLSRLRRIGLGALLANVLTIAPPCRADILFNNYPGDAGNHGFVGVSSPTVLAGEFKMGGQAYTLDSATVYPINTSGGGPLTSNALLYLYSDDVIHNRPLANTGVTMAFTPTGGGPNPVTISAAQGFHALTFAPTTPVTLQPNTGYWLALSFDNPSATSLGEAADNTLASGIAAIRAASRSFDNGVTWNAADTGSSWPMTISGTAVPEPGSLTLLGLAAIGWVRYWRRRWRSEAPAPTVFDPTSQTGVPT